MRGFLFGLILGFLGAGAAFVGAGMMGYLPVHATDEPSRVERKLARDWLSASIQRQTPRLINPIRATDENLYAGLEIYRKGCAGCHGGIDHKSTWASTALYPRAPQFAFERSARTSDQNFGIIKYGIRYSAMGAWTDMLNDHEIWQVTTFLEKIHSLPPAVEERWRHPPPDVP